MWGLSGLMRVSVALSVGVADPVEPPPEQVEITLGGPVEKVKGLAWPRDRAGKPERFAGENRPYEVVVVLPSGQRVTFWSKYLLLNQEKGTVTQVTVSPVPRHLSFHDIVTAAEREARRVPFQDSWGLFDQLRSWKQLKKPPKGGPGHAGIVEDRSTFFLQLRHVEGEGDRGWWFSIDLNYWLDKDAWESYSKEP